MLSPYQLRHVAISKNGRLSGKTLSPYARGAEQPFRFTRIRIGVELGTRM
jgi:hypothetical protein